VRGLRARHAALVGGLFGVGAAQIEFAWMYRFEAFHFGHGALLAAYVAVYPAMFAVALARFGFEARGLVYVPFAGALVEWLRAHAGFLALPWATFGQTQHRNVAVIQLAAYGGELLVGAVVVAANVAVAQAIAEKHGWRRPRVLAALATVALVHAGGALRLAREPAGAALVVSAVQPAIEPGTREKHADEILDRLGDLTRAAARDGAALVVWPESSVGALEADLDTKLAVRDIVEEAGVPIVLGSSHVEKLADGKVVPGKKPTNAAFVMAPQAKVAEPYEKVRLLPFGEYRPIDLPEWLAPRVFDTKPGARRVTMRAGDVTVEPVICWENLFADTVLLVTNCA
jgi:apolipoprotein N-acyltransferase